MRGTVVQKMFDFICVSAPLILNGEVAKAWRLSRTFLFSKIRLGVLHINFILVIIMLSGRRSPIIRPDSQITGYQPDIRCDSTSSINIASPAINVKESSENHPKREITVENNSQWLHVQKCYTQFLKTKKCREEQLSF